MIYIFFFFNDTATTEIYTLSLHDALPISKQNYGGALYLANQAKRVAGAGKSRLGDEGRASLRTGEVPFAVPVQLQARDRKSTRLNSSHSQISYAVFCLEKKKKKQYQTQSY